MKNSISVSSAPIAKLGDKLYYDLLGTIEVMRKVWLERVVDGFELQLEPEWDGENPPLTDGQFDDWKKLPKYESGEILTLLKREKLPILSVHASRDIGNYLCSSNQREIEKGKRLIYESLSITSSLGADVCVFHLWDTRKTRFDVNRLQKILFDESSQFSKVKAAAENIPTHLEGFTPFALVKLFDYTTLDLRWAAMYDELNSFQSIIHKVANVHLRGRLENEIWILDRSNFDFYDALNRIRNEWKYQGLLTMEPEGGISSSRFSNFIGAMRSLRPSL